MAISTKICKFPLFLLQSQKKFVVFAYTYVSRIPVPFYVDFCMNLYFADSDEEMKRGDTLHRFNFSLAINASSLQSFPQR
jgi:hypothetical protein